MKPSKWKALAWMMAYAMAATFAIVNTSCKAPRLEPGGVYAPTNALGEVVYNQIGLALADASHKLAYESAQAVFRFERNNRELIWSISPNVKKELDRLRVQFNDVDLRWAQARNLYRQNPTPAGLSVLQTILLELQSLATIAQQQTQPVTTAIANP